MVLARATFSYAVLAAFLGATLGCLATSYLVRSGLAASLSSASVALCLCLALRFSTRQEALPSTAQPAIYGGTFGGMTNLAAVADDSFAFAAAGLSLLCGLIFAVIAHVDTRFKGPIGLGWGGRLGAIAFAASIVFVTAAQLEGTQSRDLYVGSVADSLFIWLEMLLVGLLGIVGTQSVLRREGHDLAHRILEASAYALIGLAGVHLVWGGNESFLGVFYAGCFFGMSSAKVVVDPWHLLFGSCAIVLLTSTIDYIAPGVGGGLGLAAFLSVGALVGLLALANIIRVRRTGSGAR